MDERRLYKVIFMNRGEVWEIYARHVSQGGLLGFVEIEEPVFGERSKLIVDSSEEKLKTEFEGVRRFFVPIHSVVRIDEVERAGAARITPGEGKEARVAPFPTTILTPPGEGS